MDGSPPGSSVHGILQARIQQWVARPFSQRVGYDIATEQQQQSNKIYSQRDTKNTEAKFLPSRLENSSCILLASGTNAVQFSCSVVSNSLRPHESQHARPPCPSPIPWRREWQPTPVFLPGESHGQRSLGGLPFLGSSQREEGSID